jgi:hypothetical protein
MNRSYSKLRHIQELNRILENRTLKQTIIENFETKKSILLEAPVAKTVQVDCDLSTIDGMKMTQEMITKYCAAAKTTGGGGTTPAVSKKLTFNITDLDLKPIGITIMNTGMGNREDGSTIMGPGQSMFKCWEQFPTPYNKWSYKDTEQYPDLFKDPTKVSALEVLYKKQCQANIQFKIKNPKAI